MRIGSARRISGIAAAVLCVAVVGLASSPARAAKASPVALFAADAVPTTAAVDDSGPNVTFVVAGGLLLVGVGVVLFVGYRRRRPVKFVA